MSNGPALFDGPAGRVSHFAAPAHKRLSCFSRKPLWPSLVLRHVRDAVGQ